MTDPTPDPVPEIDESVPPVGTQPVQPAVATQSSPVAVSGRRTNRARWTIALVTVAILAVGTLGVAILLAGARVDSTVARWAPADALAYVEVRADLPGDQRQALGEFLSAFPGFADQTILDRKLDELYDRLVGAASEDRQSWSGDIAPWFGGQLGFAVGPLPAVGSLRDEEELAAATRALAIATTTDAGRARDWVLQTAAERKAPVSWTDADGVPVMIVDYEGHETAAAVTDDVLLLGDETSVRSALARGGMDGLATDGGFREAMAGLPDQQVVLGFIDTAGIATWLEALPAGTADRIPAAALDRLPPWMSGGLRFEADALVVEGLRPRTAGTPDLPNQRSTLPERLPATTIALAETHDVGAVLDAVTAGDDEGAQALERLLAPAGGLDGLLGWAGETGVVAIEADGDALPGLVAIAADPDGAAAADRSLRNLATLGGLQPTEETVDGVRVVSVDLTGIVDEVGGVRPEGPLIVSWAVSDDLVVVGKGPAFVRSVLASPSGETLADDDAFRRAVDRAAASHQALAWLDLDALERIAVAKLDAADRAEFEREIRPYLAPLGTFVGTVARDGDLERSRGLLVLDE